MTNADLRVLAAFPAPPEETWGLALCRATRLGSGTVTQSLYRLERAECLIESRWEEKDVAARDDRPPRRLYRLTNAGLRQRFEDRPGVRVGDLATEGA